MRFGAASLRPNGESTSRLIDLDRSTLSVSRFISFYVRCLLRLRAAYVSYGSSRGAGSTSGGASQSLIGERSANDFHFSIRPGLLGQMEAPRSAIGRITLAFQQTGFFKAVDDPAKRDRFDLEMVGKLDLPQPRVTADLNEDSPLRFGYTERGGAPVECATQGMRGLANFDEARFHRLPI
jgi:hypothetical protein